jgi:hypothetical protein
MVRATTRIARKAHRCECGRRVPPGSWYIEHVVSPNDPEVGFDTWTRLVECARCAQRYGRAA